MRDRGGERRRCCAGVDGDGAVCVIEGTGVE